MHKNSLLKRTLCFLLAGSVFLVSGCGNASVTSPAEASSEQAAVSSADDTSSVKEPESAEDTSETSETSDVQENESNSHKRPEGYEPYYEERTSTAVSLKDLPRDSFDESEYRGLLAQFEEALKTEGNEEELFQLYDRIFLAFDALGSDSALAGYDFNCDPSNKENQDKSEALDALAIDLQDKTLALFHSVFNSSYATAFLGYLDEDAITAYQEYEALTEEEEALVNEITNLSNTYAEKTASISDYSAIPEETVLELKELYIELVNKNNALAVSNGYDSYVEYAYEFYCRDYSAEDISDLYDMIMEEFPPILLAYSDNCVENGSINDVFTDNLDDQDTMYQNVIDYIYEINPEMGETMDHLFETGLVDMNVSSSKMEVGYTTPLSSYKDAFIFNKPSGMVVDYTTMIHEFGHYNNMYHTHEAALIGDFILDVAEIHSQGMEVLFYDYYPKANSEYGEALREYTIYNLLNSIVSGYLVNEFEYQAYTAKNLTVEKLDAIAYEVFGTDPLFSDIDYTLISHIYQSPFYYISYSTSALAALELFTLSQSDWDAGVDAYMKISSTSTDTLVDVLESAGLANICESETILSLCNDLTDILDLTDVIQMYRDYLKEMQEVEPAA